MGRTITTTAAVAVALCLAPAGLARAQDDQDGAVRDAHRVLQVSTAGSLLVTATLGTLVAINKPTLFGDGRCAAGGAEPIFGEYGCMGLSVLHGLSAILSVILYSATTAVELAAFDWPGQNDHGTAFDVASGAVLGTMALMPFLGILTAVPEVLGIDRQTADTYQRVMRTLHLSFGYLLVGTYVTTVAIDLD